MRVMVIVKASKESESGVLPDTEILTKMGKYNEELVKAGIPRDRNFIERKFSKYTKKSAAISGSPAAKRAT